MVYINITGPTFTFPQKSSGIELISSFSTVYKTPYFQKCHILPFVKFGQYNSISAFVNLVLSIYITQVNNIEIFVGYIKKYKICGQIGGVKSFIARGKY